MSLKDLCSVPSYFLLNDLPAVVSDSDGELHMYADGYQHVPN